MPDILKYIQDEQAVEQDPEGNLLSLEEWTEEVARQRATRDGLDLTEEHWQVIRFLRERYRRQGGEENARLVLRDLAHRFESRGGTKYLYQLFPKGPVRQGSWLAGLPTPAYSADPSFGSVR